MPRICAKYFIKIMNKVLDRNAYVSIMSTGVDIGGGAGERHENACFPATIIFDI